MKALLIIVATVLASAATASASPASSDPVQRLHEDAQRVRYHAQETIIAERDLVVARFYVEQARMMWDNAVARHDMRAAEKWAARFETAKVDERDTRARLDRVRAARDQARADFRDSAHDVRQLARVERASRRG